jgi:AraC-like DNA-binding protein
MLQSTRVPTASSGTPRPGSANRLRIGTLLTPGERGRVGMATGGQLSFSHRETARELRADFVTGQIDAALISAAVIRPPDVPALSAVVQDFPGSLIVGLVGDVQEPQALVGALGFGQAGIRLLVDVRTPSGWSALRCAFDPRRLRDEFILRALRDLTAEPQGKKGVGSYPTGWVRFLEAAFSPRMTSAKQVAKALGVPCSTLTSRFFRAGIPSPKRYIAFAHLVWVARLGETPGLSINAIASRMDASSPQSFGRTIRTLAGVTAAEFRRQFDGQAMLTRFRAELIEPYRGRLQTFDPLSESWAGRTKQLDRSCSSDNDGLRMIRSAAS